MNREVSRQEEHPVFWQTAVWLDAYFRGETPTAAVPLALDGTAFQKQVWSILLDIPYGETRTYGSIAKEMAAALGKEKMSAQAVGQAVGRNPVSILVPCHRVVGAKGRLTGYAGGLEMKKALLELELGKNPL
jgi:methylated-DNA-[protein]-cysteine S-methyltransferase